MMGDYIPASMQYWHQETGQLGVIFWGGLNQHGLPTAFVYALQDPPSLRYSPIFLRESIGATDEGTTLYSRLAARAGLSEEHLKSILYEWILDVFHGTYTTSTEDIELILFSPQARRDAS